MRGELAEPEVLLQRGDVVLAAIETGPHVVLGAEDVGRAAVKKRDRRDAIASCSDKRTW